MWFSKKIVPKKMKYRVVVKGITISKHTTKKLADQRSNSIRMSKVMKIGSMARPTMRKTTSRTRKSKY
jgi:hypothetical protein